MALFGVVGARLKDKEKEMFPMATEGNTREQVSAKAEEIYEVDGTQIFLNAGIAFLASTTTSIGSYIAIDGITGSAVGLIFGLTFVPAFVVKVVAEYSRRRAVVKAAQRAYERGRVDAELKDTKNMVGGFRLNNFWAKIYHITNPLCFYPSEVAI